MTKKAEEAWQSEYGHETVLLRQSVHALNLKLGDIAIDCTLGGGGHTRLMLDAVGESGKVIAFDRDIGAIRHAELKFQPQIAKGMLVLVHSPFSNLGKWADSGGLSGKIAGILADLGVSSPQIDEDFRGFSFTKDGPLDMRMDIRQTLTAEQIVNGMEEKQLAELFTNFGEEPKARHFARMICRQRSSQPFTRTLELAEFLAHHSPYRGPSRKHPATRIFQAIRMAVNDEAGELQRFLVDSLPLLKGSGRLAVISFHSIEDRAVKRFYLEASGKIKKQTLARHIALTEEEIDRMSGSKGKIISPFPIEPDEVEVAGNPRARSARLRVFEKSA
jgi:16S rRNA (cytosine1402-N4)-methyltransferase